MGHRRRVPRLLRGQRLHLSLIHIYYAVEESSQEALCIAADAGVDVRLMIPAIPDKKLVYLVAETYWGDLLRLSLIHISASLPPSSFQLVILPV